MSNASHSSHELVASSGQDAFRISTDAAQLCKQIVVATAKPIKGKRFVGVEGWQAIALAHGCVASSGQVERVETGFRALGKVIRMSDGQTLSTAEGFVGDDEAMWAARPEYARRAMAQTRSISRACRSAFAHVVVMMQAGLETTPAEEMQGDEDRLARGSYGTVVDAQPIKDTDPFVRAADLTEWCEKAKIKYTDILKKAGVDDVKDMLEQDYLDAIAMLKQRAAKSKTA